MPSQKLLEKNFRQRVLALVAQIPEGRVMTYGQIASMCGNPRAARIVGGIASRTQFDHQHLHAERSGLDGVRGNGEKQTSRIDSTVSESRKLVTQQYTKNTSRVVGSADKQASVTCPLCDLPWQRVVKKDGSLAEGFPGGIQGHELALREDGMTLINGHVDMKRYQWWPNH